MSSACIKYFHASSSYQNHYHVNISLLYITTLTIQVQKQHRHVCLHVGGCLLISWCPGDSTPGGGANTMYHISQCIIYITVYHISPCIIYHRVLYITVYHISPCIMYHRVSCITVYHVSPCIMYHCVSYITVYHVSPCIMYHRVSRITVYHVSPCIMYHCVSYITVYRITTLTIQVQKQHRHVCLHVGGCLHISWCPGIPLPGEGTITAFRSSVRHTHWSISALSLSESASDLSVKGCKWTIDNIAGYLCNYKSRKAYREFMSPQLRPLTLNSVGATLNFAVFKVLDMNIDCS